MILSHVLGLTMWRRQDLRKQGKQTFHIINFKWKMHDLVQVVVHEEYLIYDFTNMVSSVGGSLGLFIGFSFIGFIQAIIDILQNQRS